MESEVGKQKLKAVLCKLVFFLSSLLSTSFSLQLVQRFFFFCNGTFLLQYDLFSLIHLPFQLLLIIMTIPFVILWSITSHRIVFALLRIELIRIFKRVGHKANFKVEFLQTCYQISHLDVLKWGDESWKITGFLISLSLSLYGVYRKDIEGTHFHWTFKRCLHFILKIIIWFGFF